jgi:hypothetical protein
MNLPKSIPLPIFLLMSITISMLAFFGWTRWSRSSDSLVIAKEALADCIVIEESLADLQDLPLTSLTDDIREQRIYTVLYEAAEVFPASERAVAEIRPLPPVSVRDGQYIQHDTVVSLKRVTQVSLASFLEKAFHEDLPLLAGSLEFAALTENSPAGHELWDVKLVLTYFVASK